MKLEVTVKPGSKIEGLVDRDGRLTALVKAPARQGKANEALVKLLARHFSVPPRTVRILSGFRGKSKLVEIADSSR
ncbi:MAG: DUF167 domain-containing protein [Chloroflexota bacterium]